MGGRAATFSQALRAQRADLLTSREPRIIAPFRSLRVRPALITGTPRHPLAPTPPIVRRFHADRWKTSFLRFHNCYYLISARGTLFPFSIDVSRRGGGAPLFEGVGFDRNVFGWVV